MKNILFIMTIMAIIWSCGEYSRVNPNDVGGDAYEATLKVVDGDTQNVTQKVDSTENEGNDTIDDSLYNDTSYIEKDTIPDSVYAKVDSTLVWDEDNWNFSLWN